MILGIDEAGRGPVMGPLVMAGVFMKPRLQKVLVEMGVKDSKLFGASGLARSRRAYLAKAIREKAAHVVVLCIDAEEVDRRVRLHELNDLERELARAIIQAGPPVERIVADGERLFSPLETEVPNLRAMDRADRSQTVVAAASIIAKVERDQRFAEIAARHEETFGIIEGGGYANAGTARFLHAYVERHGRLPEDLRTSWSWDVLVNLKRRLQGRPPWRRPEQLDLLIP